MASWPKDLKCVFVCVCVHVYVRSSTCDFYYTNETCTLDLKLLCVFSYFPDFTQMVIDIYVSSYFPYITRVAMSREAWEAFGGTCKEYCSERQSYYSFGTSKTDQVNPAF